MMSPHFSRYSQFESNLKYIMTEAEVQMFIHDCERRAQRVPVQYILGNWDFYGMEYKCREPVLIPRPETEELVDMVIHDMKIYIERSNSAETNGIAVEGLQILDVGCGSGVIGISLIAELTKQVKDITCAAIDINPAAVALSTENADAILGQRNINRRMYSCQIQSFLEFAQDPKNWGRFTTVVSNPPYIPSVDIPSLEPEVAQYESLLALDGGLDGLDIIKEILLHAPRLLSRGGTRNVWLEVSESHPDRIIGLLPEINKVIVHMGYNYDINKYMAKRDLFDRPRFVCLTVKHN